jgi:Skp family chaperone for outer membrane proteins
LKKYVQSLNSEIKDIDAKTRLILSQKDEMGSNFNELEHEFKERSKELVKITTQVDLKKQSIKEEQDNLKSLLVSKQEVFSRHLIYSLGSRIHAKVRKESRSYYAAMCHSLV